MKHFVKLAALLLCFAFIYGPADSHVRWSIKTSIIPGQTPKSVNLDDLLQLPNAPGVTSNDARYNNVRIPFFSNTLNLTEGDIIKVTGWLRLVYFSTEDSDYHIQISTTKDIMTNCLLVEIPSSDAHLADPSLGPQFEKLRKWIRDSFYSGKQPNGKLLANPVEVDVEGQLFFDDYHVVDNNRGREGLKSLTVWEIHPVSDMGWGGTITIPQDNNHSNQDTSFQGTLQGNGINAGAITLIQTTPLTLLIFIVLGAILGMVGQVARVLVGIKKDKDAAVAAGKVFEFNTPQMLLSLLIALIIGGVAGVIVGVNSANNTNTIDKTTVVLMIAAGYAGTDLIEGLIIH